MATSAFKSTTKRSPISSQTPSDAPDSSSSNRSSLHRRSRSLSRPPVRHSPADPGDHHPRGRFVNTSRGSAFPEISLDDLANELFLAGIDIGIGEFPAKRDTESVEPAKGRGDRWQSGAFGHSERDGSEAGQRRGRSVSRSHGKGNSANSSVAKAAPDAVLRRRRSVSVVRYKCSDSESDIDNSNHHANYNKSKSFGNGNFEKSTLQKPTASSIQRTLSRSMSQKDFLQPHDGYSSFSSALTDDEAQDTRNNNGNEKTIRAVYAKKKSEDGDKNGLHEAVRKEVWQAVEEIKMQLEHVMVERKPSLCSNSDFLESKSSDVTNATSKIRNGYNSKLEQSEKRNQDLLAELAIEEECDRGISKIVRELLSQPKQIALPEKPSRTRKRSNERTRVTRRLSEEAEKYFEDFLSNVEDTDFSSFDGEKSDASSTFGGNSKLREPVQVGTKAETCGAPAASLPVEVDGVVLPWLKWEDNEVVTPLSSKKEMEIPITAGNALLEAARGWNTSPYILDHSTSSHSSWSPDRQDSVTAVSRKSVYNGCVDAQFLSKCGPSTNEKSSFCMEDYLSLQKSEDLLFERFRQRKRIGSGGLFLCDRANF